MKAHLLFEAEDFDPASKPPWNAAALSEDLGLDTLVAAMADGDAFVAEVAKAALLQSQRGAEPTIAHRQAVLKDALLRPDVVRALYRLAAEAVEEERHYYLGSVFSRSPDLRLRRSIQLLSALVDKVVALRAMADAEAGRFASPGWRALVEMLRRDLGDDYIATLRACVEQLALRSGVLMASSLGPGNKANGYVLLEPPARRPGWLERWLSGERRPPGFSIDPRDEQGASALRELKAEAIGDVANAAAQAAEHVRDFFQMLKVELAFYVGCLNLHDRLAMAGLASCIPRTAPAEHRRLSGQGLYDIALALRQTTPVVGNDVEADGRGLIVVTGANQGGKSTFLRSLGVAQLMMQAGMFVAAGDFHASVADGVFTHARREEDAAMTSGKLDEELKRMSDIVDHIRGRPLVLLNESFAATNEREGSEVTRQIVLGLTAAGVRVACVTHLYAFALDAYQANRGDALFLRAERNEDGARTFRLIEAKPLVTSFGEDIYRAVFAEATLPERQRSEGWDTSGAGGVRQPDFGGGLSGEA